jgi:hypothetical protein
VLLPVGLDLKLIKELNALGIEAASDDLFQEDKYSGAFLNAIR